MKVIRISKEEFEKLTITGQVTVKKYVVSIANIERWDEVTVEEDESGITVQATVISKMSSWPPFDFFVTLKLKT